MIFKTILSPTIILISTPNQHELASTFLRFQEYYESPKFQGKVFILEEFKAWYTQQKGRFSYYEDWDGFNFPSSILKPFYDGEFNPLSGQERQLLTLLKDHTDPFYVIGASNNDVIDHELAHALFHTEKQYKEKILAILKKYDLTNFKQELQCMSGYSVNVMDDEVQAWIIGSCNDIKSPIPINLKKELDIIFFEHNTIKFKQKLKF